MPCGQGAGNIQPGPAGYIGSPSREGPVSNLNIGDDDWTWPMRYA
jgi:hypothetical protein